MKSFCNRFSILSQSVITNMTLVVWLTVLLGFSFLPNTFLNYGYNYWRFLPYPLTGACILMGVFLHYFWSRRIAGGESFISKNWMPWFECALILICLMCFWLFRTKIHVFGGDGAVGTLPSHDFRWASLVPSGRRLDGYLLEPLYILLNKTSLFDKMLGMPRILATQVYSIACGTVFVLLIYRAFRQNKLLGLVILTGPYLFNFFGNIDSYSFSLIFSAGFLCFCLYLDKRNRIKTVQMILLLALWGLGLWTHPFHLFDGFVVSALGVRWANERFRFKVPFSLFTVLYGVALFAFIKCSVYSNNLFVPKGLLPAALSIDTFTHYLNNLLIPLAPILFVIVLSGRSSEQRNVLLIFVMSTVSFFTMAFTLGACDQFNYHHLLFVFSIPLILFLSRHCPSPPALKAIVIVNLFLLLPMIAVHTSSRTLDRATYLYPKDPCQHNVIMSWHTHLGLVLGDNFSENPVVADTTLATFLNGSSHALPQFRPGNAVYYIAFHYNFGRIQKGRALLKPFLKRYPQAVQMFLSDRPGFVFFNRQTLFDDILSFYPASNELEQRQLEQIIAECREKAVEQPYYKKRPSYAATSY